MFCLVGVNRDVTALSPPVSRYPRAGPIGLTSVEAIVAPQTGPRSSAHSVVARDNIDASLSSSGGSSSMETTRWLPTHSGSAWIDPHTSLPLNPLESAGGAQVAAVAPPEPQVSSRLPQLQRLLCVFSFLALVCLGATIALLRQMVSEKSSECPSLVHEALFSWTWPLCISDLNITAALVAGTVYVDMLSSPNLRGHGVVVPAPM